MTSPDLPQRLITALAASTKRAEFWQPRLPDGPLGPRDPLRASERDIQQPAVLATSHRAFAHGAPRAAALTPALSYGRHRGPVPADARRAAVAILWLRRGDGSWWLPLTLRSHCLRHHGGQICFPGGRMEPGETAAEAALREFQEELGQAPVDPLICGELDPLYIYASNNLVFPVVFTATAPPVCWAPNSCEVEDILEMPLAVLLDPAPCSEQICSRQVIRDQRGVGAFRFRSIAYRLDGQLIWGATAMLLCQLAQLIRGDAQAMRRSPLRAPTIWAATS